MFKINTVILSVLLCLSFNVQIIQASEWVQKDGNWYYFNSDGEMEFNSIITDKNGKKYFVQRDGSMVEEQGWVKCAPQSYCYVTEDGSLLINSTTPDGYTVDENGYWIEETTDKTTSSSNVNKTYSENVYKNIWEITTLYAKQQLKYPNTSILHPNPRSLRI